MIKHTVTFLMAILFLAVFFTFTGTHPILVIGGGLVAVVAYSKGTDWLVEHLEDWWQKDDPDYWEEDEA